MNAFGVLGMSEDYKLISAKINLFLSCFLAIFYAFGNWSYYFREDIARRLSSVVMNSENAITTEFDYFRLGLAQLGRIRRSNCVGSRNNETRCR
jgi:hypothetical protein